MRKFIFTALLCTAITLTHADDLINDIVAMVGDIPITIIDLKDEVKHLRKGDKNDLRSKESQALDSLIEKAIIDTVMKEEVISISQAQVEQIIKKTMVDNNIPDEKTFEEVLKREVHLSLDEYRIDVLNNLKIQQILQLKINTPSPQYEEVKTWYNRHQKEIGNKYLVRIIKKAFNPNNPKEELSVNQEMNRARDEAVTNFPQAAAKYSDDSTASAGGSLGWLRIDELAGKDPMLANIAYQTGLGQISKVFISRGNYFLLKVDAIAPISLDEAAPMISQRLFQEKQQEAYRHWVSRMKKSMAVKVYLKDYKALP